ASGKLHILTNVGGFAEGLDVPAVDAVMLVRPTKSFPLYCQMIGRSLRVAKGKRYTTILDHAGPAYGHGLPASHVKWSLSGRRSGAAEFQTSPRGYELRRCPKCFSIDKWSKACPECGYTFQIKDRTNDEIYGELRQVKQGLEYETQKRFAKRCKLTEHV